jgi:hypothetical protein
VHFGSVLLADFIEPMNLTRYKVAKAPELGDYGDTGRIRVFVYR